MIGFDHIDGKIYDYLQIRGDIVILNNLKGNYL